MLRGDGGAEINTHTDTRTTTNITKFTVGGLNGGGTSLTGDIAEILVFNSSHNAAQLTLTENYLQAKYNDSATNNFTVANDVFSGDTTLNGNYDFNAIGIGRGSDGEAVLSSSDAGLGISASTPSDLDNGDFVMAAHNGASGTTTVDIDNGTATAWAREWFVDTNANNTLAESIALDLTFDFIEANLPGEFDPSEEYVLLYKQAEADQYEISSEMFTVDIPNESIMFSISSELFSGSGGTGIVTLGSNIQFVPEPTSIAIWSLIGVVLCGIAYRRFNRRQQE